MGFRATLNPDARRWVKHPLDPDLQQHLTAFAAASHTVPLAYHPIGFLVPCFTSIVGEFFLSACLETQPKRQGGLENKVAETAGIQVDQPLGSASVLRGASALT